MIALLKELNLARSAIMFLVAVFVISQGPWGEWMQAEAWRMPVFVGLFTVAGTSIWRWKDKNSSASEKSE